MNEYQMHIDPTDPQPPPGKREPGRTVKITAVAAFALGAALTLVASQAFAPGPEPVTPEACVAALDTAEDAFGVTGTGFTLMGELIDAVVALDVDTVDRVADDFEEVASDLTPLTTEYRRDAAKCRASL